MRRRRQSVSELVAIGQLVIAGLMLWSLWQSNKSLQFTRLQVEAAKRPQLEASSFADDKLHLLNTGGADLEDVGIIGFLAAHYNPGQEITRTQITGVDARALLLKKSLRPNEELSIDFKRLTFVSVGTGLENDEQEAFSIVFRYYRTADHRPFYKIISFMRVSNGDMSAPLYLYFPLQIIPGTALSGPNNKPALIKVRKSLQDICSQYFDIHPEE